MPKKGKRQCVYPKCTLGCKDEESHRRRYAVMKGIKDEVKDEPEKQQLSKRINVLSAIVMDLIESV